ncbi:MAG: hypothetical protein IT439_05775, partial [Phycisphaerales bacterium]|nr:hypothetical protein [Phycisphaerales bacterium]
MCQSRLWCVFAIIMLTGVSRSANEIQVDIRKKSGAGCSGGTTTLFFNKDTDFTINISACDDVITIWDHTAPRDSADRVTINGSGNSALKIFIGSGSFPATNEEMTPALHNFGGLTFNTPSQRIATSFAGRISGHLTGSVNAGFMYRFDVDGQIQAGVYGDESGGLGFEIHAGSISSSGYLLCGSGNFRSITTTGDVLGPVEALAGDITAVTIGGNLRDDVLALVGRIGVLNVDGSIGTPSSRVTIKARDRVQHVAADAIHANIEVTSTTNDLGWVQRIYARGDTGVDGDFTGSIKAMDLSMMTGGDAGITIAGDLDADLQFSGKVTRPIAVTGAFLSGRTIRIAEQLASSGTCTFGSSGLLGQIVINASNGANSWTGDVTVGSTTLATTPYYSNLPSALGGGAVGLVPYRVHGAASVPASGSTVLTDPASV